MDPLPPPLCVFLFSLPFLRQGLMHPSQPQTLEAVERMPHSQPALPPGAQITSVHRLSWFMPCWRSDSKRAQKPRFQQGLIPSLPGIPAWQAPYSIDFFFFYPQHFLNTKGAWTMGLRPQRCALVPCQCPKLKKYVNPGIAAHRRPSGIWSGTHEPHTELKSWHRWLWCSLPASVTMVMNSPWPPWVLIPPGDFPPFLFQESSQN